MGIDGWARKEKNKCNRKSITENPPALEGQDGKACAGVKEYPFFSDRVSCPLFLSFFYHFANFDDFIKLNPHRCASEVVLERI
jgi:hypothetical protein